MASKPIDQIQVDFEKLIVTLRLDEMKLVAKEAATLIKEDAEGRAVGSIRDSFLMRVDRGATIDRIEVKIGTDKKHWYARFFDTGARSHVILAKKSRVLVNQQQQIFFGRTVHHPGMHERPLLKGAIQTAGPGAADLFNRRIKEVVVAAL